MVKSIWKYILNPSGYFSEIIMPEDATVLTVGAQGDDICLWVLVLPSSPLISRAFVVIGTGEEIPPGFNDFIGTVFIDDLVFHIFE